jgi:hypothetical protein
LSDIESIDRRLVALESAQKLTETLYSERLGNLRQGLMHDFETALRASESKSLDGIKAFLQTWLADEMRDAVEQTIAARKSEARKVWVERVKFWVPLIALGLTIAMWGLGQITQAEAVNGIVNLAQ